MAQNQQLLTVLIVAAVCGLAVGQNTFGTSYGDTGSDAPYLQSLSPTEGPKQGGTQITLQGAGFRDDSRALCRFSRLNPSTETTITKTTASTFVSSTEVTCASPEWEEDACPSCAGATALTGTFFGHTGSPYLRSSSNVVPSEIGVGDYIQLAAATIEPNAATLTQYYQIKAIQACTATNGCYCSAGVWAEGTYSVAVTYNGTGAHDDSADKGFEIVTPDTTNCALYRYDKMTGGAGDDTSSLPTAMWPNAGGADCTPECTGGAWAAGTMITLSEPVYKIDGTKNVKFSGKVGYRATKYSCTSCKCAGGCVTTLSHSNDGVAFSGGGIGGEVWSGSALSFSLKDIVPSVAWITHNLPGYRDSSRIFGPASGGTTITVVGKNFQDSPLLRCYFAGVRTLVKAEWIDSEHVRCKTPAFMSRQYDIDQVQANQDGTALNPHSKVHVTNDGMVHSCQKDGIPTDAQGNGDGDCASYIGSISRNPHLNDDGSKSYIHTFATTSCSGNGGKCASYTSGEVGHAGNPYRSTCQEGLYPNEGNKPCYSAHTDTASIPKGDGLAATTKTHPYRSGQTVVSDYSAGNDVLFKYATCYDSNPAAPVSSLDYYANTPTGGIILNSTAYPLGAKITITGDTETGPLSHIQFHFQKATDAEAKLKINVCAGTFCAAGGINIAEEVVLISKIVPANPNYAYNVFFSKPPYMLAGTPYYVQVSLVSGATDVEWKTNTDSNNGYYANTAFSTGFQFRLRGFTCDGCRTKYSFAPALAKSDLIVGANPAQDEAGGSIYFSDSATSRSMLAQELRPTETGTITHTTLKLKNQLENNVNQAYVSIWITKYAKYGEYVCSVFAGDVGPAVPPALGFCDTDMDGTFTDACTLGSICDPNAALNGGCGNNGACTLVETATNGHRLRPEPNANAAGPCGDSSLCDLTMTLAPDHQQIVSGVDGDVTFEFKTPVPVEKHTTYFVNVAVVGNPDYSKPVVWYSGVAHGDGGVKDAANVAYVGTKDTQTPSNELRASFTRDKADGKWKLNTERVFAIKFKRCVSSTAQVFGFSTSGDRTGCCSGRASPQGGDKGATITVTGRNFFPGDQLACVFRNEDGTTGAITKGTTTDASYTTMTCPAPTLNPHSSRDCTNPALCQGVVLAVTNDGFTVGPHFLGPKWDEPTASSAVPSYLGLSPLKFLFSEIHVSVTGSDTTGDGTIARPYNTIQKGVDASNEFDQIVLLPGVYVGIGNRGLRHHGKKIELKAYSGDRQNTIIDCQHAPDGFILNNNKDSDSPFAGFIDTQDIITRNCENLRIYDI